MPIQSEIARAAGLSTEPVAIIWTDEKPERALEFRQGVWSCVMWPYAKVAREGRTAVFSRETIGCAGGAMGLGFGRPLEQHVGRTEEGFCCFLSNGIEGAENREEYAAIVERSPDPHHKKMLLNGERLMKSPAVVLKFLKNLPLYDVKDKYIVMKPLSRVEDDEKIRSVVFLADADQISALSILANYHTGTLRDRVTVAGGAAGCQAMGVCTYAESGTDNPRAVIGLTDIMARKAVRRQLGKDKLTFSVPYSLFLEMEKNVPGSFLESDEWKELRKSD
jgi:uncharacterized protein (DUF169 family)